MNEFADKLRRISIILRGENAAFGYARGETHVTTFAPDGHTVLSETNAKNKWLRVSIADVTGWMTGLATPASVYDRMQLGSSTIPAEETQTGVIAVITATGMKESDSIIATASTLYPAIAITRPTTVFAGDSIQSVKTFENRSGGNVSVAEMAIRNQVPTAMVRSKFATQTVVNLGYITIDHKLVLVSG